MGFEPTISAGERPYTYALDRAATGTGFLIKIKGKVLPQQAELAQGVPSSLRPQIISRFGTTKMVGRQPYAPAAFTPGEIHSTDF